jgi:hypothetical protein
MQKNIFEGSVGWKPGTVVINKVNMPLYYEYLKTSIKIRLLSSGMWCHVVWWMFIDVSEECAASIFMITWRAVRWSSLAFLIWGFRICGLASTCRITVIFQVVLIVTTMRTSDLTIIKSALCWHDTFWDSEGLDVIDFSTTIFTSKCVLYSLLPKFHISDDSDSSKYLL